MSARSASNEAATESNPDPVDFGTRFSAYAFDAALLFGLAWVSFFALSRQLQAAGMVDSEPCGIDPAQLCEGPSDVLWGVLVVMLLTAIVGYHAVFDGWRGATPGKRLLGITVVDARADATIGVGRALLRSLVRQWPWLALFLVLDISPVAVDAGTAVFVALPAVGALGLMLGAVAPDGRAAHDHLAGTRVVWRDDVAAPAEPSVVPGEQP